MLRPVWTVQETAMVYFKNTVISDKTELSLKAHAYS
jgi:hypothetical protein